METSKLTDWEVHAALTWFIRNGGSTLELSFAHALPAVYNKMRAREVVEVRVRALGLGADALSRDG